MKVYLSIVLLGVCLLGGMAVLVIPSHLRPSPVPAGGTNDLDAETGRDAADQRSASGASLATSSVAQGIGSADRETAARMSYVLSCAACHGQQGQGMPHQGPELRHSKFVASRTDEQLVTFVRTGRMPNDRNSVMRLFMPPSGGNPSLKSEDLSRIIRHLRSMQGEAAGAAAAADGSALPSSR